MATENRTTASLNPSYETISLPGTPNGGDEYFQADYFQDEYFQGLAGGDEYFQDDYFQDDYFQGMLLFLSANLEKSTASLMPVRSTVFING